MNAISLLSIGRQSTKVENLKFNPGKGSLAVYQVPS
jgi:hypothetical protein